MIFEHFALNVPDPQAMAQWVIGLYMLQHFRDLANQVDRLVEGHDQIAFGKLDAGADLGQGGAMTPGASGAVKVGVVAFGNGQALSAFLAEHGVLDILDAAAGKNETVGKHISVAIAELPVE